MSRPENCDGYICDECSPYGCHFAGDTMPENDQPLNPNNPDEEDED